MNSDWLTVQQAAEYLQMSPHTLYHWRDQGLVRVHKGPGEKGMLRFRREDLDAALTPSEPLPEAQSARSA